MVRVGAVVIALALAMGMWFGVWTGYDTCVAELTSAACGDGGTALDAAFDVCDNLYVPGTPTAVLFLCSEALVTHRDAGIGFESLATEF